MFYAPAPAPPPPMSPGVRRETRDALVLGALYTGLGLGAISYAIWCNVLRRPCGS